MLDFILPNLPQWAMIFIQPMEQDRLHDYMASFGAPTSIIFEMVFYIVLLIIGAIPVRAALIVAARSYGEREYNDALFVLLGMICAGTLFWTDIVGRIFLFGSIDPMALGRIDIPALYAVHRAVFPFDVAGISDLFGSRDVGTQLRQSILLWHEDTRGLYIYPAMIAISWLPGLRLVGAPLIIGAMVAMCSAPMAVGMYNTSLWGSVLLTVVWFVVAGGFFAVARRRPMRT